jgi:diguanylate cyclase (GGDEF)-like protein
METETLNLETDCDFITDKLTGLPGQNSTAALYQGALEIGLPVLLIDIDHFSAINNMFSYKAGDRVLKDMGRMIRMFFPENQSGRKGGDEFVVTFEYDGPESQDKAHEFVDYVSKHLTVQSLSGCTCSVTISAGYARGFVEFDPDLPTCEFLLKQAKLNHKNCLALFLENECVFRRGSLLSPASRKYLGKYSFIESKQLLDLFRWYYASRIDEHFDKTLGDLTRMMNYIVS